MQLKEWRVGVSNTEYLLAQVHPMILLREWFEGDEQRRIYVNFYHYLASQEHGFLLGNMYKDRCYDDVVKALKYIRSVRKGTKHKNLEVYQQSYKEMSKQFIKDSFSLMMKFTNVSERITSVTDITPTFPALVWEDTLAIDTHSLTFDFAENSLPDQLNPIILEKATYSKLMNRLREGQLDLDNFTISCGMNEDSEFIELFNYKYITKVVYPDKTGYEPTEIETYMVSKLLVYMYLQSQGLVCVVDERGSISGN